MELLDPTDIVASQLRNYERFKIDGRIPPIVADNSTLVLSSDGEIYQPRDYELRKQTTPTFHSTI